MNPQPYDVCGSSHWFSHKLSRKEGTPRTARTQHVRAWRSEHRASVMLGQVLRPRRRCYSNLTHSGCRPRSPSTAREGQPECDHLAVIANQQEVADQRRVVPGLAFECRESRDLGELVGGRPDQRRLTLLRQHQQQVLVGKQDELAVAVASAFPLALAVLEVDAREDVAVEAEGMVFVND